MSSPISNRWVRAGCLFIGYLHLAGAAMEIMLSVCQLTFIVFPVDHPPTIIDIVPGFKVFFMVMDFVFTIVILVGLHENNPKYLGAFVKFSMVFFVINFIIVISPYGTRWKLLDTVMIILLSTCFPTVVWMLNIWTGNSTSASAANLIG